MARPIESNAAVPISVARRRLFELVEDVLAERTDRVILSHKGYTERVVLVRAGDLAKLEADLAALRSGTVAEPRPLRGLGTLHVDPDQVLVRSRARQARLAAAKRETLRRPADDSVGSGSTEGSGPTG